MTSRTPQAAALDRSVSVVGIDADPPRLAYHWPRRSRLELGPLPSAVPCARLHAKVILQEWNLAQLVDDAELIVSELTTNALKASMSLTETQPIAVDLLASHDWLIIQVWDALPAAPDLRAYAPDAEAGRGLQIVSLLSDRWGFYCPRSGGKTVWAAIGVNRSSESAR
jgi:anti-sigma regulatory factor (Ser/Thr protein kinase)